MGELNVDLADPRSHARVSLIFKGAIVSGVDGFGELQSVHNNGGNDTTATEFKVEPAAYSGVSPSGGIQLDGLQRMIVFAAAFKDGFTMVLNDISFTIQWTRDSGTTWVDFPVALIANYMVQSDDQRSKRHSVIGRFPANFMQTVAAANDINDTLDARLKINASSSSTGGEIILCAQVLMLPGAVSSANTKPRGAVFSDPGMDY